MPLSENGEQSYICLLGIQIFPLSKIFILDFWNSSESLGFFFHSKTIYFILQNETKCSMQAWILLFFFSSVWLSEECRPEFIITSIQLTNWLSLRIQYACVFIPLSIQFSKQVSNNSIMNSATSINLRCLMRVASVYGFKCYCIPICLIHSIQWWESIEVYVYFRN